jgi:CubicO group peptidase (beta-lactamase class C family)
MRFRPRSPALLLALSLLAMPAWGAESLPASLDGFFSRLADYGFSGSVLVTRHGETLLRKGYGLADRKTETPVEPDTAFDVGSITKQFTATAILRLEMDGKLSTEDRLGKFLPGIAKSVGLELPSTGIRDDLAAITLHQMLAHTSGIDNFYLDQSPSWKEYLQEILKQPLAAPPGAKFLYSNTGYDLLAKIVEVVSGEPYERYVRDHLLLPAGLRSTGFDLPKWNRDRIARYQDWTTREWAFPVEMPIDRPAKLRLTGSGGMLSTVDDLYRWHQALLGDRILSAAAKAKLYRPVLDDYGYGWRILSTDRGTRVIYHGGYDTSLGVAAAFYRFVDEDTVFILLANTHLNRQLNTEFMAQWVENLLFGGAVPMPPASDRAVPPRPGIAGRYALSSGGEIGIFRRNGRLILATEDPEAILRLSFPDALAPDEPVAEDEQMTRIFRGIDGGDWEPLRAALGLDQSFDGMQRQTRAWWETQKKELGGFVSVRPVYQLWQEYHDTPELQIFLRLDFERGRRILRALRGPGGRYEFRPEKLPEKVELTLAPQSAGTYNVWNFRYQTGPRIVFEASDGGSLKILGRRAVATARRKPAKPGESVHELL